MGLRDYQVGRSRTYVEEPSAAGSFVSHVFAFAGHQSRRHPEVQHGRGAQLEGLRRAAGQRYAGPPGPSAHLCLIARLRLIVIVSLFAAKINEDNFGPEDDDIQFDDCGYGEDDDVDEVRFLPPPASVCT